MLITEVLIGQVIKVGNMAIKVMKIKGNRKVVLLIKAPREIPIEKVPEGYLTEEVEE